GSQEGGEEVDPQGRQEGDQASCQEGREEGDQEGSQEGRQEVAGQEDRQEGGSEEDHQEGSGQEEPAQGSQEADRQEERGRDHAADADAPDLIPRSAVTEAPSPRAQAEREFFFGALRSGWPRRAKPGWGLAIDGLRGASAAEVRRSMQPRFPRISRSR